MYTDDSPMPVTATYRGTRLGDVPASCLHWCSLQTSLMARYPDLRHYIAHCPRVIAFHHKLTEEERQKNSSPVPQTSKSAVSQVSKPASLNSHLPPVNRNLELL